MPVYEMVPLSDQRVEAVADILLDIANRLMEDLDNTVGMIVILTDDMGCVEIQECGLSGMAQLGLLEYAKHISITSLIDVDVEEDPE